MTTVILDEITRNAVLAALDERAERLAKEVARAEKQLSILGPKSPILEGWQQTLVWNTAALHETNLARLQIGEAEPWSESEMRLAAGDR